MRSARAAKRAGQNERLLIATLARLVEGGELIRTGEVAWIDSSALFNRRATLILSRVIRWMRLSRRVKRGTKLGPGVGCGEECRVWPESGELFEARSLGERGAREG